MERPGNLYSYPPKQHYGLCRHKGKHSGLDVARLNKVRIPVEQPGQGQKIGNWIDHDEEHNDIVTRSTATAQKA